VFLYLGYHHLRDPLTALRECARVLSSSGHLLAINATVEILDSLRCASFFPISQRNRLGPASDSDATVRGGERSGAESEPTPDSELSGGAEP
jgi:hypothetical protein